jgi:tartrate dehydratase beta subunit/fumarate hydratase class I family protein
MVKIETISFHLTSYTIMSHYRILHPSHFPAREEIVPLVIHDDERREVFYLGSVGGAAANLAEHVIKRVEVVEFEELGMEAVWRIEVEDFPALIIVDDKGNDFFSSWKM